MIRTLALLWRQRNTPRAELVEINRLLVKAGRRCAYDLRHAADELSASGANDCAARYYDRASDWLSVFNPADDGKNYRDELHEEIGSLVAEIKRLKQLCRDNDIDPTNPKKLPF